MLYAFDLLFLDGHDLRPWKLGGKGDALKSILDHTSRTVMLSEEIEGDGPTIWAHACRHELEGIVSKRATRPTAPAAGTSGARPSACSLTRSWSSAMS